MHDCAFKQEASALLCMLINQPLIYTCKKMFFFKNNSIKRDQSHSYPRVSLTFNKDILKRKHCSVLSR